MKRAAGILLVLLVSACGDEAARSDDGTTADDALIGGKPATTARFPATLHLSSGCTAAKVAPKKILTAAHCVFDPSRLEPKYGPNKPIKLARQPSQGHTELAVAEVHVHPRWKSACSESYCAISAVTAKLDAPDVAVIELAEDITEVPIAKIDPRALTPGNDVLIVGFGCTEGVHLPDGRGVASLLYSETRVASTDAAVHEGSPVTRADMPVFGGNYVMTGGPASIDAHAGLCPGDSGGPLYAERNGALVVVGVNANYTLRPDGVDAKGLPVTNWHTRLDEGSRNKVLDWLRSIGAAEGTPSEPSSTSRQP